MERESQQRFWKQHSVKPSLESMMLDSRAKQIDEQDRPEVRKHWQISFIHFL